MHRIAKGEYGYIRNRRGMTGTIVAILLAVAFGLYFGARAYFHTNQNWFTIFAILVCLPAAREIVRLVMLFKAKGCSREAYASLRRIPAASQGLYDLYMTSEKQNFDLSHVFAAGKTVIALTEDPRCDARAGEQHIRRLMQQNNLHGYTVRIFPSLKPYLTRLEQLGEEGDRAAMEEELRALLLTLSL